jgi:hypothetical protein
MTTPAIMFGPAEIAALQDRTEYEAWLLEAVYDIIDRRIAVEGVDELIYPPSGAQPKQTIYLMGAVVIGGWQPGFLRAGAPLVLATAFKLLDMLLEWVLAENGSAPSYRFVEKIAALKRPIRFPAPAASRPWLQTRLLALYERLEPLRGTIIHDRHFKSSDGALEVSSSKWGTVGPVITFSPEDLRNLAVLLVSLLRYVEGVWTMDEFREKRIRRVLDELAHLHLCASLGQLVPGFLNVRIYVSAGVSVRIDLAKVRRDVATKRPDQDVMFDLRVVSVAPDGSRATAYLVPWGQLQDPAPMWERATIDLGSLAVALPADLDLSGVASDLRERGPSAP